MAAAKWLLPAPGGPNNKKIGALFEPTVARGHPLRRHAARSTASIRSSDRDPDAWRSRRDHACRDCSWSAASARSSRCDAHARHPAGGPASIRPHSRYTDARHASDCGPAGGGDAASVAIATPTPSTPPGTPPPPSAATATVSPVGPPSSGPPQPNLQHPSGGPPASVSPPPSRESSATAPGSEPATATAASRGQPAAGPAAKGPTRRSALPQVQDIGAHLLLSELIW
jgi:hypothetical protein